MNTIIDAIKQAAAIDRKGANLWVTLCNALKGMTHEAATVAVANGEAEWKEANPKATSMPSAWRSAKSVALTALKNGIALHDDDGKVRGKTEIEQAIKDGKADKPVLDKIRSTLDTLNKLYAQCDADERKQTRDLVAAMSIRLYEEAMAQGEAK